MARGSVSRGVGRSDMVRLSSGASFHGAGPTTFTKRSDWKFLAALEHAVSSRNVERRDPIPYAMRRTS